MSTFSFSDHDQATSPPPPPKICQSLHNTSLAVYDALKLKINGQFNPKGTDPVDLSMKTSDSMESEEDTTPLTAESVIERIRRSWHNARQRSESDDVKNELDADDVLTLKVPRCVKYLVVEREGKRQKFAL